MKSIRHMLAQLLVILTTVTLVTYPALAANKEQLVKAAFLYNFTKFTSWPEPYNISSQSEISVCILGNNPLGDATSVLKKGSTANLKINAKIVTAAPTNPGECHILYISQSKAGNIQSIIKKSATSYALTVSDIDGFVDKGGMIGFVKESNKIRLYINKGAAEAAGLKLDAQLLEIARKVIR